MEILGYASIIVCSSFLLYWIVWQGVKRGVIDAYHSIHHIDKKDNDENP